MAVSVELSDDEALVLFDLLTRYSESDRLEITDQAEQRALWNVCADLERVLVQPLDPAYGEHLAAARERLRDPYAPSGIARALARARLRRASIVRSA